MALTKVTTGTIADDSIQSLKNRNLIINGAMRVAQRSTSSTTSGYGTVDRFHVQYSQVSVTQTQETLSSGDPYDLGFRNFLRATNTSVSAATNAYCQISQRIEAQNVACSGWNYLSSSSYVTLSFWARSSLAGTYVSYLRTSDGTLKSNSFEFTLPANTWTKVTKTFLGDSSLTINNDNGDGMNAFIVPYYGTDLTDSGHTDNVWQTYSSTDISSDFAQNWCNTASATFDLTGVQLEVGEVVTPFEHESYGQTLYKCKRYFEAIQMNFPGRYNGAMETSGSGVWGNVNVDYEVLKRATPTITHSVTARNGTTLGGGGSTASASVTNINNNFFRLTGQPSGLVVGYPVHFYNNPNSSWIQVDAEL